MYLRGWIGEMVYKDETELTADRWLVLVVGKRDKESRLIPLAIEKICLSEADAIEVASNCPLAFVVRSIEVRQKPPRRR